MRRPLIPARRSSGSFDEAWPMSTENRHRLWGFGPPCIVKHMTRVKTAVAGFYALNGTNVLRSIESLHKKRIVEVFEAIHEQNPPRRILLVLDNFSSHFSIYAHASGGTRNHAGFSPFSLAASAADRTGLEQPQAGDLTDFDRERGRVPRSHRGDISRVDTSA